MSKADNLGDFLKGLADKFRAVLGGEEAISPQRFEELVEAVQEKGYETGYSEGGPEGCTAAAGDVLSGKVFGTGGSGKATGTMVSRPAVTNAVRLAEDAQGSPIWAASNGTLAMGIPLGAYVTPYTDSAAAVLQTTYAQAAAAIGLTASKIVAGNTILGVTGTASTSGAIAQGSMALTSHVGQDIRIQVNAAGYWSGSSIVVSCSGTFHYSANWGLLHYGDANGSAGGYSVGVANGARVSAGQAITVSAWNGKYSVLSFTCWVQRA